jgi:pyruvate formate lyase activating enzyme
MQPELAEALLRLAKAECISTALETCGHTQWPVLARLLPYLDDVLYDLKHIASHPHQRYAGLDNGLILSNLRQLVALQAPVTVRVPLIPGFNASPETIRAIVEFVMGLDGAVKGFDLLPYHTLGQAKYKALGRAYPWADHQRLPDEEVTALAAVVEAYGLAVRVGG